MKIRVENDGNNIVVICPNCKTRHIFVYVSYGKYLLNGQEDDEFIVTGGVLYPDWVCRGILSDEPRKYCFEEHKLNVENI